MCQFDVSIVGAGPAGLCAAYYAGQSGLRSCVLESSSCVGGQCSAFYPNKDVHGVPGVVTTGAGFVDLLSKQISSSYCDFFLRSKICKVERRGGVFRLYSSEKNVLSECRYLIVASGVGEMIPTIPDGISWIGNTDGDEYVKCCCFGADIYEGKTVVVVGGGDSAIDFVDHICATAKNVMLVHRRSEFSVDMGKIEKLKKFENFSIFLNKQIISINQNNVSKYITVKDVINENINDIFSDYVVFCCGFSINKPSFCGLDMKMRGYLIEVDNGTMETSTNGCFAIGDCVFYVGKRKDLISCFFEASRAVRAILESDKK